MELNRDEEEFFELGKTFNLNKLIITRINIDDDDEIEYNATVYATYDKEDSRVGYLHFKPYDGTSEDFEPAYSYRGYKISDVKLTIEQNTDYDDNNFFVFQTSDVEILTCDGKHHKIETPSMLDGLSLVCASKVFLIDLFHIILYQDENNNSYQLS